MTNNSSQRRIAVVGSGAAGLAAAYVLRQRCSVVLFEADDRLGGHADTWEVDGFTIDCGFIVHNRRTYPLLTTLLDDLGVNSQETEMSMSVQDAVTGLEYAGGCGWRGLTAQPQRLVDPRYLHLIREVIRFRRAARSFVEAGGAPTTTLGDFLAEHRFGGYFRRHYAQPLIATVWSMPVDLALGYPASSLFAFLLNHGMLEPFGALQWRTVVGGSQEYVRRVAALVDDVRLGVRVSSVSETSNGVVVTDTSGRRTVVDAVVIATHADQALALLRDPTPAQTEVLGAIAYTDTPVVVHRDPSVLPRARRAWACWNFARNSDDPHDVTITYDLTRLMRLSTPTHYLVTLGNPATIDPGSMVGTTSYSHPQYSHETLAAQARLSEVSTARVAFAGSYYGWGFHEDAIRSGVAAARRLGVDWPGHCAAAAPTLFTGRLRHVRRSPIHHTIQHRAALWVVDVDDLLDRGIFGRFEARDHLGDPTRSLRENVVEFLRGRGVERPVGRILMAANPRALGHCFNPVTVFWCFDDQQQLMCTLLEVQNTYGQAHTYLLTTGSVPQATFDKMLYVSPFHPPDGRYEVRVPPPTDTLEIEVALLTADGQRFDASFSGWRSHTRSSYLAVCGSWLTSARIFLYGLRLWFRLPVIPRTPDASRRKDSR